MRTSVVMEGNANAMPQSDGLEPDAMWTYKRANGRELKMSVFLPDDYPTGNRFATFVVYHGGSWNAGEANWHYPDCAYWSRRGMIAVSVDYRLRDRDQVEVPLECVKDAKSAIRFLRKNAARLKIDRDRIVAAGGSAGGQLAAATAMVIAPYTNDDHYSLSISCNPNAVILYNPWFQCQGDLLPTSLVTGGLPPFITFLGDRDKGIRVESLLAFHEALRQSGNVSEFYVGKGGGHGFCNGRNLRNPYFYWSLGLADRFLVEHGILTGKHKVRVPDGVRTLEETHYSNYE